MPIKLHQPKPAKTSTPKQTLPSGKYAAVIAGIIYPKDNPDRAEYLLQVHGARGICYVPTYSFFLNLNEKGGLFKLLKGISGAENIEILSDWLRKNDFTNDEDMFDETYLVGYPVTAEIEFIQKENNTGNPVEYSIVTGISCAPAEYTLDESKLIPSVFGSPRYTAMIDNKLEMDKPYNGPAGRKRNR